MEKIYIHRAIPAKDLPVDDQARFVDFTMVVIPQDKFHKTLADDGYYLREGKPIIIDGLGINGTSFTVYKLDGVTRTDTKIGELTTFREADF